MLQMKLFGSVQCGLCQPAEFQSVKFVNAFSVKHDHNINKFVIVIHCGGAFYLRSFGNIVVEFGKCRRDAVDRIL